MQEMGKQCLLNPEKNEFNLEFSSLPSSLQCEAKSISDMLALRISTFHSLSEEASGVYALERWRHKPRKRENLGSWKEWCSRKWVKRCFRETEEQGADLEQEDRGPRERMFWKKGGIPRIEKAGHWGKIKDRCMAELMEHLKQNKSCSHSHTYMI